MHTCDEDGDAEVEAPEDGQGEETEAEAGVDAGADTGAEEMDECLDMDEQEVCSVQEVYEPDESEDRDSDCLLYTSDAADE